MCEITVEIHVKISYLMSNYLIFKRNHCYERTLPWQMMSLKILLVSDVTGLNCNKILITLTNHDVSACFAHYKL